MAVVQLQIRGFSGVQKWMNVFHMDTISTPSIHPYETAKQIVALMPTTIGNDFQLCLPEDSKLTHLSARVVDPDDGYTAWHRYEIDQGFGLRPGSFSNNAVNPVLLGFNSAQARRVAKIFFGGVSDTDIDGNQLVTALTDNMVLLGEGLVDGTIVTEGGAVQWAWCIPASPAGPVRRVTGWSVAAIIGTQRRRRTMV